MRKFTTEIISGQYLVLLRKANLLAVSYHAFGKCVKWVFTSLGRFSPTIARRQGALPARIVFARVSKDAPRKKTSPPQDPP